MNNEICTGRMTPMSEVMQQSGMNASNDGIGDMVLDEQGNVLMSVAGLRYAQGIITGQPVQLRTSKVVRHVVELDTVRWAMYDQLMSKTKGKFQPGENIENLRMLCAWLQSAMNRETRKGMWVHSEAYGNGKTTVCEAAVAVMNWARSEFTKEELVKLRYAANIADEMRSGEKNAAIAHHQCYGGDLMLDDVGSTTCEVQHYGNRIAWVSEVIMRRYDRYRAGNGLMIVTSNIRLDELHTILGPRAADRLNEMFCFLEWRGGSHR